ncbi:MAG: hypothetical protein EOP83_30190, partial [Verrucomicrobiaceae bacterium]
MAVIDTFLKLMLEKRAERLVLVSDAVPYLLKGGETIPLSMPAFREDMLGRIAREITGEEVSGRREGTFRDGDGAAFGYAVLPSAGELRIEVHAAGAMPPPVEEDDPLTKAVANFAKSHEPAIPKSPPPARSGPDLLALIDQAVSLDASDLFLSSGKQPRVRRNGTLTFLEAGPPDAAKILELIPDEASRREFDESGSTDFGVRWELSGGSRRFRINVFR